jgi:hypothetical protein
MPDQLPLGDHRETTGERLVRIETLMTTVLNSLHAHIRDEERALKEMKDTLKAHMDETARVNVDVRELGVDVRAIKEKLGELEKEVFALSKAKTSVIAWAAGVSATVSALWIVAGPRIATFLGG